LKIYKKINSTPLTSDEINKKLSLLPQYLQNKISNYVSIQKKQQRIEGLELLLIALKKNEIDENGIFSIYYNNYGKPFINPDIDFSISYSNTTTVLGFITNGWVGVDVEQIKPIDCSLHKEYFTTREWMFLIKNSFRADTFFQLWTRKEAVVKAIGKGAFLDFNLIEVLEESITIDGIQLFVTTEFFDEYCLSIACSEIR